MSSNSGDYTPRAVSDKSNRSDSGYASSSRSNKSYKKNSNSRYDRMTLAMEDVASQHSRGGKSMGIEKIQIRRTSSDSVRGSVQSKKKRVREPREGEGEEGWERQELEQVKKSKRSRLEGGGPGASSGSLGEGFKLMNGSENSRNWNYEEGGREEEDDMLDDGEDGFNLEVRKESSPSGSGRTRTVVRDRRMNSMKEVKASRTAVPPWLHTLENSPKQVPNHSPPPLWLANHLYGESSPAQTILSEPFHHPNVIFSSIEPRAQEYRIPIETIRDSSSPFQAPPFSTSGRTFSRIDSPRQFPPKPFFEAQMSRHEDRILTTIDRDHTRPERSSYNIPPPDPLGDDMDHHYDIVSSPSIPPFPSHHSETLSNLSPSYSNVSPAFELYRTTNDLLSDTMSSQLRPSCPDLYSSYSLEQDEERELLKSFWKDSPNVATIQTPNRNQSKNRDTYSTHLLQGANAYSLNIKQLQFNPSIDFDRPSLSHFPPPPLLNPRSPSPATLDYEQLHPHSTYLKSHPQTQSLILQSQPQQSIRYSPLPTRHSSTTTTNSITPVQNRIRQTSKVSSLSDSEMTYVRGRSSRSGSKRYNSKEEEEELWRAVDGIVNSNSTIPLDTKVEKVREEEDSEKENEEEQLLIEGLRFDWEDGEENESAMIGVNHDEIRLLDEGVGEIQDEEAEKGEEEEAEADKEEGKSGEIVEEWLSQVEEERNGGSPLEVWEDPEDPIEE